MVGVARSAAKWAGAVMTALWDPIDQVLRHRRGVSATEYALLVFGMAALTLAGWSTLGGDISAALAGVGNGLVMLSGQL